MSMGDLCARLHVNIIMTDDDVDSCGYCCADHDNDGGGHAGDTLVVLVAIMTAVVEVVVTQVVIHWF